MKLRIAIVLLVLSTPSHADGPTDIHGFNDAGEEITVYQDGQIPVDPPEGFDRARYPDASFTKSVYTIDVKRRGERKAKERYQKQDCGIDARSTGDFFCDGKGTSPLAGTRYVRIKELTKCRGTLLMCSTGCGPRAPRTMIQDPWECDSGLVELGLVDSDVRSCEAANAKTKGILYRNEADLRESPDPTARILARLTVQTKLQILERKKECLTIDNEQGQWVRVKVMGKQPLQGWVFDAYVEYIDRYPNKPIPQ